MVSFRFNFPFIIISALFFIWGFITSLNDILVPYLKNAFVLNYFQATLVQFSFFGAYFIGSALYFLSGIKYGDLIERIGYKNCIIAGLVFSALGCACFYPASQYHIYGLFLGALCILGLGFTLLQIAANPYVIILGPEKGASGRLNLAQGINSLGTTVAPLIGGQVIFRHAAAHASVSSSAIQNMYLLFASVFVIVAVIFGVISLPQFRNEGERVTGAGALKYPHLVMGIIAIFTYVGGEVSIGSLIISFSKLPEMGRLSEKGASIYVACYWGGLMIGRFIGAVSLHSSLTKRSKYLLMFVIPCAALGLICFLSDIETVLYSGLFLALNIGAFFLSRFLPARTIGIFSLVLVALLVTTILAKGSLAIWTLVGAGLFNSVMWSNIFALSVAGLGKYTSQGSSLLIMAIIGAALVPVLQGVIADSYSLQQSFVVPLCCYLYLVYYGFKGYKSGTDNSTIKKQLCHESTACEKGI